MPHRLLLFLGLLLAPMAAAQPYPFTWENAIVYFVMPDRFANGDPSNDQAYGRGLDGAGQPYAFDETGHFHGGDLRGLTQKISEGYFDDLGVNALWITPPFEQVRGWTGGGVDGDYQAYSYSGYWIQDFTEIDENLGTKADFAAFVETAHAHGIRVLLDVVVNHVGYPTLHDMAALGFGTITDTSWQTWRPSPDDSWHSWHLSHVSYLRDDSTGGWQNWWGPGWIRGPYPGHEPCGSDEKTQCLAGLPDLRTEATEAVGIPLFLQRKWGPEKLAAEQASLDAFFARTGYPRTPRYYLIKWLTDWVRTYGIDGFRIDTAKHVEPATWRALKQEATAALRAWKAANPSKRLDELPFWMVGEVFGHALERSAYFDQGFDAVLNFDFQKDLGALQSLALLDQEYQHYDRALHGDQPFQVLSYLSSHDTHLHDRAALHDAATRLLLLPGGVQIYYGDETARPAGPAVSSPEQATRSPMNWEDYDEDLLAHWQKLGQFRARHPALAVGDHVKLQDDPYIFARSVLVGGERDAVIVALGAKGRTSLNVSRFFPDDALVRDAYSGKTAFVSFGLVSFTPGPAGILLLEEVK